jgi:hypothetical protein
LIPSSGNSCGASLSSIPSDSEVFMDDQNGDEHWYKFGEFGAVWHIWDGTSTTYLSENGLSSSGLRGYYKGFGSGKSGEVFLLTTAGSPYLEINMIDSLTFEMKIYLSESTCLVPSSGNSCGLTLRSFPSDRTVNAVDSSRADQHIFAFGEFGGYWQISDGTSTTYLNEIGLSPSGLRGYYQDIGSGKSGEAFLHVGTDPGSVDVTEVSASRYEMNIYLSSFCTLP